MNIKEKLGINKSNPEAYLDVGGPGIIDMGIPLIQGDNVLVHVTRGFTTNCDSDGNVTVDPGIAYNKFRLWTTEIVTLHPTNTGIAHTEYTYITAHGSIALTQDLESEWGQKVRLGHVDVDASGKATAAYDDRDLNLYLVDEVIGQKSLSDLSSNPNSIIDSGSISIDASSAYIPTKGWWNFMWDNTYIVFQIYADGDWRGQRYQAQGSFWCDGINMRLYNNDTAAESFFYQNLG